MSRFGLRRRLLERFRPTRAASGSWAPEPTIGHGRTALSDGRVLERSALVNLDELTNAVRRPGRLTLTHHWATWAPAVEVDVPLLLELHLGWAQYVDFIGVSWELMSGSPAQDEAAWAVDDFHRSFGLTWRSLIYYGGRKELRETLHIRSEMLPQTVVHDRDGKILYLQEGGLDDDAAREMEGLFQQITGDVERSRPDFG